MKVDAAKIMELARTVKPLFLDHEGASRIQVKGVADFVTQVDLQVQEMIQKGLRNLYPDIQFMGEEKDNSGIDFAGAVWILDPVDGTTNLVHRFDHSAVSLALAVDSRLELGIVYNPYRDELFHAVRGGGAYLNGNPIHVGPAAQMREALISVGTAPYYHELADRNFERIKSIFLDCQDIRRLGSAALDLSYVACGRIDAYFEPNLKPWDYGAGALLVKEAGGCVTDFEGREPALNRPCCVVAGTPGIHRALLERYL